MNYLDIFFLVVFIIGGIKGYMKGFIIEIFSFFAFFVGLFVAIELTIPVANRFFDSSDYYQLLTVGVFVILFLIAVLLINLAAKIIKKAVDLTFMGFFDNILGALAGIFKWAFIVSVFFWVFDSIGVRLPSEQSDGSLIFPYIESIGPKTFEWISKVLPFLEDMIDSLKNIGEKGKAVYTFL
ncbi:CvpA family protein [Marinoscillum sp.]|uniref:CvpA family protein n=1 Tax=Marinoscillum sp. TaxID=2024838 RepID=UPI003BABE7D9